MAARELPNNIEAEQALLGAILVNNAAYDRVKSFLQSEHFYEPLHRKIYLIASELINMGKLVTPVTIRQFLPSDVKVGDITISHYVARLASEAVTIINTRDYGMAVHELYLRRQMAIATEEYLESLYDGPPSFAFLDQTIVEDRLAWARSEKVADAPRRGHGQRYLDHLDRQEKLGMAAGVPLFMNEIGRIICEPTLIAGNLYGLVASSGEGKTSWMLQLVLHALQMGHPVLVQSYDQDDVQFMAQLSAQQHAIEVRRQAMLHITPAEREKIVDLMLAVDQLPLKIEKCHRQNATQLVAMAASFVRKFHTGKTPLIVTDHIQAVQPDEQPSGQRKRDRAEDAGTKVKEINQTIKTGAGIVNAAWMMLNQRNTFGTTRANPRPIAGDVHGGQSALYSYDTMIYLYRFKKFLEERKRVAVGKDWGEIEKIFPSDVRQGADIVEMGALKLRFGDMYQEPALLDFEARYTRYLDKQQAANDQEELAMFLSAERAGGR